MSKVDEIQSYIDDLSNFYQHAQIKNILMEAIGTTNFNSITDEQYTSLISVLESYKVFARKSKSRVESGTIFKDISAKDNISVFKNNAETSGQQTIKIITEIDQGGKYLGTKVMYDPSEPDKKNNV